jgi:alkylation response protein AidB-like acyl-CoA dehydrogenase/putative sterol carrier protein
MSPYFTPEHDAFRNTVRQFIAREVAPIAPQWEKDEQIPRSMWKRLGELGFLGVNLPEDFGGTGADFFYSVVLLEELARSNCASFAGSVSVHEYMAMEYIRKFGSGELKFRYLKPGVAGEKIGAIAVTEPNAGSDVAAIRTKAVRDGDTYILNGSKTFITNGHYGDFIIVAAKTSPDAGAAGISLFLVDRGAMGFSSRKLKKIGMHASDTAELTFDNVRVPQSHLVGEENKGFYYIMQCFALERLVGAVISIGGIEQMLDTTLRYASEREAFGKPLAKFQVIRHTMADLKSRLEAVRQLTYNSAWLYARGEEAVQYCAMAKLLATELAKETADVCLQVFGGYGYMEEYPISRAFCDARVGTIVGGTSEIMREIIAKFLVDGVSYGPAAKSQDKPAPPPRETAAPKAPPAAPQPAKAAEPEAPKAPAAEQRPAEPAAEKQPAPKKEEAKAGAPETAADIIRSFTDRFRPEKAGDYAAVFHFDMSGSGGGQFSVTIGNGACSVEPGLQGQAKCVVQAAASTYCDIEFGRTNAEMAFMTGKIKISNVGEMMRFVKLFNRVKA